MSGPVGGPSSSTTRIKLLGVLTSKFNSNVNPGWRTILLGVSGYGLLKKEKARKAFVYEAFSEGLLSFWIIVTRSARDWAHIFSIARLR